MNLIAGRQGKARQGKARQGKARQGKERQGKPNWVGFFDLDTTFPAGLPNIVLKIQLKKQIRMGPSFRIGKAIDRKNRLPKLSSTAWVYSFYQLSCKF